MMAATYVSNLISHHRFIFFKKHNLSQQQYRILYQLRNKFPQSATMTELSESMVDIKSDMPRLTARLCEANLIERKAENGRAIPFIITQTGLDVMSELDKHIPQLLLPFTKLTDEEMDQLMPLLERTAQVIEENES